MATLQQLTGRQVDEALAAAVERQTPATLTIRAGRAWANFHSRILALRDGHLWLELPTADEDGGPSWPAFAPADKVGVAFKLKHHKHIFTATVAGMEVGSGGKADAELKLCSPARMHRMQRRAFVRADVPPQRVVRASFWLGGLEAEPAGTTPENPVWTGRVLNISAGGFQLSLGGAAPKDMEPGDSVGVRISFGAGEETVYAEAQFRHIQRANGEAHLGFQFVALAQTPEGKHALELIGTKAAEFQRQLAAQARA